MYRRIGSVLLVGLCVAASGCSEEEATQACPAKGIGVMSKSGQSCSTAAADPTSEAGKDCRDQLENYRSYGCAEQQICPDQGKRKIPDFVVDPTVAGQEGAFILTNCSTGNKTLTISKVALTGDSRCSFEEPEVVGKEVDPGETAIIRTVYLPKTVGEDHAALYVYSDAKNIRPLIIPICGRGIAKGATSPDGGATSTFDCKEVGKTCNDACHPTCKTSVE